MTYVLATVIAGLVVAIAAPASATTASQREYRRGYADCAANRWDANQHGESYKKGCRAAEDGRAGATAAAQPARRRLTRNDRACIAAVRKVTRNSRVVHVSSEMSQANDTVIVGVGPRSARWRCLVNGGRVADVRSLTDEGKL